MISRTINIHTVKTTHTNEVYDFPEHMTRIIFKTTTNQIHLGIYDASKIHAFRSDDESNYIPDDVIAWGPEEDLTAPHPSPTGDGTPVYTIVLRPLKKDVSTDTLDVPTDSLPILFQLQDRSVQIRGYFMHGSFYAFNGFSYPIDKVHQWVYLSDVFG